MQRIFFDIRSICRAYCVSLLVVSKWIIVMKSGKST